MCVCLCECVCVCTPCYMLYGGSETSIKGGWPGSNTVHKTKGDQ